MVHPPNSPRPRTREGARLPRALGLSLALGAFGCGEEERPAPLEPFSNAQSDVCELAEPPDTYFESEFLDRSEYWRCSPPRAGAGNVGFVGAAGTRATVTGGFARFDLDWDGEGELAGRELVLWVGTLARGFYTFEATSNDNPQHWEFRINPEMPTGDYDLFMAVSEGRDELDRPIIGTLFTTALHVIQVGTGDIQVNLYWNPVADLDLGVREPDGTVIYGYARRSPMSSAIVS